MYGEMKLALFIYLWYPKTKGSGYIYDRLLQPYVSRHETDIDRSLIEFRERAWNLAIYYWHNCTELGSTKILQFLQFVSSRSTQNPGNQQRVNTTPEPSAPPHFSHAPRSENETHLIRPEDVIDSDGFNFKEKLGLENDVSTAKHRLRRFIDGN
ncbi:hypothetical protein SASPL_105507 [Salvia splendens]|uniref:HVA22-like protein n=2 Tax=Salvia splendens TaxID=180675 RepID=A0A8X9AA20_SALSN|nr:hypothetical protein SASPL_105507 [Salvia splendens]